MKTDKDYQRLTQTELDRELTLLEERLSRTSEANQVKNLFQNLRIHQVELEMQNRELREVLETLDDMRERYTDLYDFAPVGYMTLDARGVVRDINLTGATMLGQPRSELLDRPFAPRVEPGYGKAFFNHLRQVFEDPVKTTVEITLRSSKAQTYWVSLESLRVRSGNDTVCRTAMIDITERQRVEEDLRHKEQQLRNVTDAVPVLIAYVERDMRYRFANATYRHWFGLEPEEMIGRHADGVMEKQMGVVAWPFVERALRGEQVSFENFATHRVLGQRRINVKLIPDLDRNGNARGYFAVSVDITDRGENVK